VLASGSGKAPSRTSETSGPDRIYTAFPCPYAAQDPERKKQRVMTSYRMTAHAHAFVIGPWRCSRDTASVERPRMICAELNKLAVATNPKYWPAYS
jgi:hypothetical protein